VIYLKLPPFNPVALGVRSTTQVQRWQMTLGRIVLKFIGANALTKATISEVVVKIGARVIFGPISATELDAINKYRGIFDQTDSLTIDFTERDGLSVFAKEVGGIDLPALGDEDVFIEVANTAGAGTPALYALGGFTGLQFDPAKPTQEAQLIRKVLSYNVPTSGGTAVTWMPDFKGAIVQRIHFRYTGTDWSAGVNGNLREVEVRKNGVTVWDRIADMDARFIMQEQRKVPQSKTYHLDFVHDNVHSAALSTLDARALEFNLAFTAVDTVKALVECLDTPRNL
jgi:Viral coat protein P2 N-terminal domain